MDEPTAFRLRQQPAPERGVMIKRRGTCPESRNFRLAARQKHSTKCEPPLSSSQIYRQDSNPLELMSNGPRISCGLARSRTILRSFKLERRRLHALVRLRPPP
jgi:hypothetical protein